MGAPESWPTVVGYGFAVTIGLLFTLEALDGSDDPVPAGSAPADRTIPGVEQLRAA
jgi:hypothetical protein